MKKNLALFVLVFAFSISKLWADNGNKNVKIGNAENLLFAQRISQVTHALKAIHLTMKAERKQKLDDMVLKSSLRQY